MRIPAVALVVAAASSLLPAADALDNGVALTPPMGFNSYMAPGALHNEAGLGAVADFFVRSGLHTKGYTYVNTDEGWELGTRNAQGALRWDPILCVRHTSNKTNPNIITKIQVCVLLLLRAPPGPSLRSIVHPPAPRRRRNRKKKKKAHTHLTKTEVHQ